VKYLPIFPEENHAAEMRVPIETNAVLSTPVFTHAGD